MYHLRLKGDHYEMGVKRGNIFNKCGITFPLNLDDFQKQSGYESEKQLQKFFPEICKEIKGVTDTIKADYAEFAAWLLCMGCCMYNLESNIPVEIRGCTAFAFSDGKRVIYGRNNDLPPYLRDSSNSEIYAPLKANKFNITTSSFINGEEGVNEHGLAVSMTFVNTKLKDIKAGFNSCFIVRYLLEKAYNTEHAINLLNELPIASNCNILLADKSGNMVVVECTPLLKQVRTPIETQYGKIICTVNNFTSENMKQYDYSDGNVYNSVERYNVVVNSLPKLLQGDVIGNTQKLLKGEYGFMCQYEKELCFETVWSSIFDLASLSIYRAEGSPMRKKFISDNRLCKYRK